LPFELNIRSTKNNALVVEVIPKFSLLIRKGEKVTVMDRGLQSRCYLFVCDAVNALDTILHKHRGTDYEIYNISSREHYTTLEVAMNILSVFGYNIEDDQASLIDRWVLFVPDRPFHDMHYFTNCEKLERLGWKQRIAFSQGIAWTVEWYRNVTASWWDSR
jgi:dTDP-D-glucose 4,6-dehydratase